MLLGLTEVGRRVVVEPERRPDGVPRRGGGPDRAHADRTRLELRLQGIGVDGIVGDGVDRQVLAVLVVPVERDEAVAWTHPIGHHRGQHGPAPARLQLDGLAFCDALRGSVVGMNLHERPVVEPVEFVDLAGVGSDFCRFGVGDSTALGIAIEERFQGLASPAKMKLAVTGCPRNCAEALCKDLGVVAVDGGRWEMYVGGAAGAHIRKGDLLATVDSADEVMTLTGRFLQYYRENANWLERTYAWVPRLGIEAIRAVVVDDAEGIAAELDARMTKSVGA